jgi:hypothetical protein
MGAERCFIHIPARPERLQQLILGGDMARALDQQDQCVEYLGSHRHCLALAQQAAFAWLQRELPELVDQVFSLQ